MLCVLIELCKPQTTKYISLMKYAPPCSHTGFEEETETEIEGGKEGGSAQTCQNAYIWRMRHLAL